MDEWVKMPSKWILNRENPPLKQLSWRGDEKSSYTAALILYIAICHFANRQHKSSNKAGCAELSYSQLAVITSMSRAKISSGISILTRHNWVTKDVSRKTNSYHVSNYAHKSGWAKLPAKHLYDSKCEYIKPFAEFKLRHKVELARISHQIKAKRP